MNFKRLLLFVSLSFSLMTLGCSAIDCGGDGVAETDFTMLIDNSNSQFSGIFDDSEKVFDSDQRGTRIYRGFNVSSMLEVSVEGDYLITYNHTPFNFKNITLVFRHNVKLEYPILGDFSKVKTPLSEGRKRSFYGGVVSMESPDTVTKKEVTVLNSIKKLSWTIYGFYNDAPFDASDYVDWHGELSQTATFAKLTTIVIISSAHYFMTDDYRNHFISTAFHDNNKVPINSEKEYEAIRNFKGGVRGLHLYVYKTNHKFSSTVNSYLAGLGAKPDVLALGDYTLWLVTKSLSTNKSYVQMDTFIHELNHTRGYLHESNLTEDTANKGKIGSKGLDDLTNTWINNYGKTNEMPIDYITEAKLSALTFSFN